METPLLYRQLQDQLRQWVRPKDQRHLQGFSEIVAAILQSQSACLGEWITYLRHRDCQARAHMERLSYFVHNLLYSLEIGTLFTPVSASQSHLPSAGVMPLTLVDPYLPFPTPL